MRIKVKKNIDIIFLLAYIPVYILTCCTAEFFKVPGLSAALIVLGFVCWLLLISTYSISYVLDILEYSWPGIICIIMLAGFSLLGYNCTIDLKNMIFIIVLTSIFQFYIKNPPQKSGKTLLNICIMDILIACIFSIYRLIQHPELARYLATSDAQKYTTENLRGVVSFGVIYGITYIFPVIVDRIWNKETKKKYLWIISAIVLVSTIILAQFTIAILLCGFGIITYIILKKTKQTATFIRRVIMIALIVVLLFNLENLLANIIEREIFQYEVNARLEEVRQFLRSGSLGAGTDMFARWEIYMDSINAFISNYMLGKALIGQGEIGGHSEILDILAEYGLVYFILCVWYFKNIISRITGKLAVADARCFKICVFIFLIGSFINTSLWSATIVILFGVAPLLLIRTETNTGSIE